MAEQITGLLKSLDANTLNTVANLANTNTGGDALGFVKNLFSSTTAPELPVYPQVQTELPDLEANIDLIYYTGLVVSIVLILWNFVLVINRVFVKDQQTKQNIEYSNELLFGHSGLVNNLFMLWVVMLSVIYIIYGIGFVNNQFTTFTSSVTGVTPILSKLKKFIKF
jgi:hypothetical protein